MGPGILFLIKPYDSRLAKVEKRHHFILIEFALGRKNGSRPLLELGHAAFSNDCLIPRTRGSCDIEEIRRETAVQEKDMATGTVKWFNPTKGYGFIQPEDGGDDVFVHVSAVEQAGLSAIDENQKISYELETGRNGKTSAVELKLL